MKAIIAARKEKAKKLEEQGVFPWPVFCYRTHQIAEALKSFDKFLKSKEEVVLAGRIVAKRGHGSISFLDIKDGTGKIQIVLRKDGVGEKAYRFFKEFFDLGDFIEVRGRLIKTKTGERSLAAGNFRMLAKSTRPLPEKWHGLKDIEERYRKRYLDLVFNDEVRRVFEIRGEILKRLREFLNKEGFLEVETPTLQPVYGGARARPFKTHLNALDMDMYLRISPELYLKRLLIGGFEKVFEIGKCFRNEGVDRAHNPEFTMLEFYWAFGDYKELMKLTEKMIAFLLKKIVGKTKLDYEGSTLDFKTPWERIDFTDLLMKETGIKYDEISAEGMRRKAGELGVEVDKNLPKAEVADEIYKKYCREKIKNPTFVIHHPIGFQPLAKASEKNKKRLASFQVVVAGMELVNAFSELNNPIEQEKRFREGESLFKKGLPEAQRFDRDYIEALGYGMPPAAGFGMGVDRLAMLVAGARSLREAILFPTMRPK